MRNQKLFVRIIAVILAALMALSVLMMAIPARAVSQSDLQELDARRSALEKELEEQESVVQALKDNSALIIDRKAALDRQIELNQNDILLMEEQIAVYDALLAEKETELSQAQEAEDTQSGLFRSRMRTMEENGNYGYFSFLFEADSLPQLMSRLTDINDIMHYDQQLEEDLRQAKADVEVLKREYEAISAEQSVVNDELNERRELLSAQVDAACLLIANLDELTEDAEREYAAIEEAEKAAYQEELEALAQYAAQQAAWAAAAAASAAAQSGSGGAITSGSGGIGLGGFIWPVDSTYISSRFGQRSSPTAGASTNHQAVDISAAANSPVYAAADGTVAVATYNSGLGNYVSITHADGTSTRYSHLSSFTVSAGQHVTQGQVIGYVGATGIATGNHLDFAISQNGQSVDPMQYFDSSSFTYDPTA